jgi:hypothetical protein
VVFGAPEVEAAQKPGAARFLTVQPNLEVVAYLESADARQICTLSRFAAAASRAGGPVQTFALRRESLYGALESGMTLDEVRTFLIEHGKTELPANVERMLSEWAGRRESLVLRTKVVLALGPAETRTRGRALNSNVYLLPSVTDKIAAKEFTGWTILAVVYCGCAKKSGMWLNSHGVAVRAVYYPLGVVPSCGKPRVSARPF